MARAPTPPTGYSISSGGTPLLPFRFVGRAGHKRTSVEIWETKNILFPDSPSNIVRMIAAFSRPTKLWVGTMDLRIKRSTHEEFTCRQDLDTLALETPDLDVSRVVQVSGASLLPQFRGFGIGASLYVASAALAWNEGLALVADACFMSSTSDDAKRVWASREFRKNVLVGPSGLVGVYRPRTGRRAA